MVQKLKKGNEEFINQSKLVHGNKYDYSLVDYDGARKKVTLVCPIHGPFDQEPSNHLNGAGCPICLESKGEKFIDQILAIKKIKSIRQHKFIDCTNKIKGKGCRKLPFDFYLPMYNTCIEYDGEQHFRPVQGWGEQVTFDRIQRTDKLKNQYCKKNGIKLIRIPYTMKKEEIEPYILKELGIK